MADDFLAAILPPDPVPLPVPVAPTLSPPAPHCLPLGESMLAALLKPDAGIGAGISMQRAHGVPGLGTRCP